MLRRLFIGLLASAVAINSDFMERFSGAKHKYARFRFIFILECY